LSRFAWEPRARADLRGIDQAQALSILHALNRFGKTGVGDIRKLAGDKQGRIRIRVGNWRIILRREGHDAFRVYSVDDRKDAYRT
jgi:mRNA-degrading endonuclease RelE of RelBE toxin-antitoxin system